MSDSPTPEAAEFTGYNREYVKKLIGKIWKQPEDERKIKIRNIG